MKLKFHELQIPAFFYDGDGQWWYRSDFLSMSQTRPYHASLPVRFQFGNLSQHRIARSHGFRSRVRVVAMAIKPRPFPAEKRRGSWAGIQVAMALHAELEEVRLQANDIDSLELIACHRALVQARLRFLLCRLRDRYC